MTTHVPEDSWRVRLRRRSPLDWPLAVLLASMLLAWAAAGAMAGVAVFAGRFLLGTAVLLGVPRLLSRPRQLVPAVALLSLGLLALDVLVLLNTDWPQSKLLPLAAVYASLPRGPGESIHPNVAAAALLILLPFPAVLLVRRTATRTLRALCGGTLGLALVLLVLTQSRAAWLAFGCMLLGAFLLVERTARRRLAVTAALGLLSAFVVSRLGGRLLAGWPDRQLVWTQALTMLQDFGLTGVGPGGFAAVGAALYPDFRMGAAPFVAPHAHNLFLQVGVDLGLGGLVAYLAMLLAAAANAWQAWRRARLPVARAVGAALLLSLLGLCIDGLLDVGVWNTQPALAAWAVLGLAAALRPDW